MPPETVANPRAGDVLDAEAREAWREYLTITQGTLEPRYSELEPWAWRRLQTKLRAIATRRRAAGRGRGLAA